MALRALKSCSGCNYSADTLQTFKLAPGGGTCECVPVQRTTQSLQRPPLQLRVLSWQFGSSAEAKRRTAIRHMMHHLRDGENSTASRNCCHTRRSHDAAIMTLSPHRPMQLAVQQGCLPLFGMKHLARLIVSCQRTCPGKEFFDQEGAELSRPGVWQVSHRDTCDLKVIATCCCRCVNDIRHCGSTCIGDLRK